MSRCQRCDKDVNPVHELGDNGRVVSCCPTCLSVVSDPAKVDVAASAQSAAPKAMKPATTSRPADDVDLIAMMKGQLAVLDEEIATLTKRQAYAEKLRRMIAASEDVASLTTN